MGTMKLCGERKFYVNDARRYSRSPKPSTFLRFDALGVYLPNDFVSGRVVFSAGIALAGKGFSWKSHLAIMTKMKT